MGNKAINTVAGIVPDEASWAWNKLKIQWQPVILAFLIPIIFFLINLFIASGEYFLTLSDGIQKDFFIYWGYLVDILLGGAISLGIAKLSLSIVRCEEFGWKMVFLGFGRFFKYFFAYLLFGLSVILASLLLIIPGIVVALQYSMIFFIMADDPEIGIFEAFRISADITYGHKWRLFKMQIFFLLTMVLTLFTLGIGLLFLYPWYLVSLARFYEEIKLDNLEKVGIPNLDNGPATVN